MAGREGEGHQGGEGREGATREKGIRKYIDGQLVCNTYSTNKTTYAVPKKKKTTYAWFANKYSFYLSAHTTT